MVAGSIVHSSPRIDSGVVMPWSHLVDDDFSLVDDGLKQEVCRE
jgi:hypothetical protein